MHQAIIRLSGQVPEYGLAFGAISPSRTKIANHLELLTVCGGMFFEFIVSESPSESGFAYPRIANQDDLRRSVRDRFRRKLAVTERLVVNAPNANDLAASTYHPAASTQRGKD